MFCFESLSLCYFEVSDWQFSEIVDIAVSRMFEKVSSFFISAFEHVASSIDENIEHHLCTNYNIHFAHRAIGVSLGRIWL